MRKIKKYTAVIIDNGTPARKLTMVEAQNSTQARRLLRRNLQHNDEYNNTELAVEWISSGQRMLAKYVVFKLL